MEKITKMDIKLLSRIAECKFLSVKQLSALSQRPLQVIRRRLRYFSNENLVFTEKQGFGHKPGRRENIIILTAEGMKILEDRGILSKHAAYVTDKTSGSIFIEHELLVNWFIIHLLQICRDNPRFQTQHLTKSSHDLKIGNADKPLLMERFSVGKSLNEIHSMIPDGVFTITDNESEKSLLFFLEVDMGSERLIGKDHHSITIQQKIINYQLLFHEGHYKRYENIFNAELNGFRLLFMTNTTARMKSISNLVQETPPSKFIWITDQEKMFSRGIAADIWAKGGKYDQPSESILGKKLAFESTVMNKIK